MVAEMEHLLFKIPFVDGVIVLCLIFVWKFNLEYVRFIKLNKKTFFVCCNNHHV